MQTQKKKKLSLPEVFPMQAKNLVKNQNNPIITDEIYHFSFGRFCPTLEKREGCEFSNTQFSREVILFAGAFL